jgi:hypothetical protein
MHDESKQDRGGEPETEHIIILQLLRDDRPEWWSRADVLRELHDIHEGAILGSLEHLGCLGLLDVDDERVRASGVLRHLDTLGFIGI